MRRVTVYSDYACPWCYLGTARLQSTITGSEGVEIEWVHFPLSPDTPPEGRDAVAYLSSRGIPVQPAIERLAQLCAEEGLAYSTQLRGRRITNTQRAQELALWAAERLDPESMMALHRSLFRAYHVELRDLYDVDVLVAVAVEHGLDAEEVRGLFNPDAYAKRRLADWERALAHGVRGVPTFARGERKLVGAQPRSSLNAFVSA